MAEEPTNGNGEGGGPHNGQIKARLHRDSVIMRMAIAVTIALTILALISQLKPSDWTIMTIVVQILAQALTALITGWFALQQRGEPTKGQE